MIYRIIPQVKAAYCLPFLLVPPTKSKYINPAMKREAALESDSSQKVPATGGAEERKRPYRSSHRNGAGRLFLWGAGLASLIWFLVRVIPKPSRAAYPCQRAAAPVASAFVVWLLAVMGAKWAWVRRLELARQRRFAAACACTMALLACAALAIRSVPESASYADNPPHGPIGAAMHAQHLRPALTPQPKTRLSIWSPSPRICATYCPQT